MFGISDIPKFFLAFFLVLPIISLLHEAGHVFFAWLMGAKNIKVSIGTGRPVFQIGRLEICKYYFWYGFCTFENLKRRERFSHILIFLGGSLFNALGALAVILLMENQMLEPGMLTYQFTYFSLYYIFFALLPMPYPDGNYSDGKIILDLLRKRDSELEDRIYRIHWDEEKCEWCIYDHQNEHLEGFEEEEAALKRAHEMASANRPSRIMNSKEGEDKEVHHYPRIPL